MQFTFGLIFVTSLVALVVDPASAATLRRRCTTSTSILTSRVSSAATTSSTSAVQQATSTSPAKSSSSSTVQSSTSSAAIASSTSNGSRASNSDVGTYLSLHNSVRGQHGASNLAWNNTLAVAAQKWSDACAFKHSGGSLGPFGENLAAGTGSYSITNGVTAWTNEASQYNTSNPQASHFTQVVWKSTTQLGCAISTCGGGTIFPASYGTSNYVVCEYYPQGNVIGQFAQNVQA